MKKLLRITTVAISLQTLLKGQLKYMSDYYELKAISSPGKTLNEYSKNEGVEIIPLNLTRKITLLKDFISLIKLILILIKEKPDIVHTHTPKAGLIGMLASKIVGVPIRMHTVAGLPLMVASGLKQKLLVFIEKLTYACATNVYPNSFNLKDYIIDNRFCKENKLNIIGKGSSNGIDTSFFSPTEQIIKQGNTIKKNLNIPNNAFIFLFVGRIVKDKGINELVQAFTNMKSENSYLVLVGNYENDLNPVSNKTLNEIKNNSNIIEAGYQSDVRPYFAMSDVFVFPSYREGFPNVVLQAAAMETPSIVSNINGSNEIIKDNENGLIVETKDTTTLEIAMRKLLNNDTLLNKFKLNCRKHIVTNYERTYIWEQLLIEYKSLLENV